MKHFIFSLFLVFGLQGLSAQASYQTVMYLDGVSLSQLQANIIEVNLFMKLKQGTKYIVRMDYGQGCQTSKGKSMRECYDIMDGNNERILFDSKVAALNALDLAGWELISSYGRDEELPTFIFKRRNKYQYQD